MFECKTDYIDALDDLAESLSGLHGLVWGLMEVARSSEVPEDALSLVMRVLARLADDASTLSAELVKCDVVPVE